MKGNVTRTFFEVKVKGFRMDGFNKDGMPNMVTIESEPYVSARNNDLAEGKRVIKGIDATVIPQSVTIEVLQEYVMSMALDDFYTNAVRVERDPNGRVKVSK